MTAAGAQAARTDLPSYAARLNGLVGSLGLEREKVGLALLAVGLLAIAAYRWAQFAAFDAPPGSDGGQWLTFAHRLQTGENVRSGIDVYPPLVPVVVWGLSTAIPPLAALKVIGILASVLLAVPAYLLLRTELSPWTSAGIALLVPITPYHSEVLSFGGYPQLAGTSFLLLTLFFLLNWWKSERRRWLIAAVATTALTVASHVLASLELVIAVAALAAISALLGWRNGRRIELARYRTAALWWALPAIAVSLPLAAVYRVYVFTAERSPANPLNLSLSQMLGWFSSEWRWEFMLWLVSGTVAVALLTGALRRNRLSGLGRAGLALLLTAAVGLMLIRELRFLQVMEIGLVLWMAVGVSLLARSLVLDPEHTYRAGAAFLLALLTVSLIAVLGARRSIIAFDWYRVVDRPALAGLDWLSAQRAPGDKAVTTAARRGHNYGWWIEGHALMPTYMAADAFLFLDPREREKVELAGRILSPRTEVEEVQRIADAEGIRYLFLDTETLATSPERLERAGFLPRFEEGRILIMERAAR